MAIIVLGKKSCLEFHRDLYSDLCFSIYKETSFASYVDDNTPCVTAENLDEVIKSLEKDSIKLFQWFSDNQMKANHDKCHLLVSGKNNVTMNASGFKTLNAKNYSELKTIAD